MTIDKALEILKHKEDYIVPNSDFDEALEVAINFIENIIDDNSKK